MIIVEGVDGSGKSSLVETLLERFPALVLGPKFDPPGALDETSEEIAQETMDFYTHTLVSKHPEEHAFEIFDRHFFSELVYGTVMRGIVAWEEEFTEVYTTALDMNCPLIIYCRPLLEVITDNVLTTKQRPGVLENLGQLLLRYDVTMFLFSGSNKMPNTKYIHYDYTQEDALDRVVKVVERYIQHSERSLEEWRRNIASELN